MKRVPEPMSGIPILAGSDEMIDNAMRRKTRRTIVQPASQIDFPRVRSACAIALHMHQPLIPAGGDDLRTARLISNLQHMMEQGNSRDKHDAHLFYSCYKRLGDLIPRLVEEGKQPRVMLEYSGTLLHGLHQMGLDDVFDDLRAVTCNPDYQPAVEWLGCAWGHAVVPSTPVQDYRLHVRAWQHHFAAIFGTEALSRVRGFSPAEMALPNHPDVAHAFVKTLKECGYQWLLVQEHTVEQPHNGAHPERPHLPHRFICTNSAGETATIIAIIKTQGSDTKLVGQMQPYYEARELSRWPLAGKEVPPLVTQIADGENGGVMMNEFPSKYLEVVREASGTEVPLVNVSEYLEYLLTLGIQETDFPPLQPSLQHRIWDRFQPGEGSEKLAEVIATLKREDDRFHVEGGSWTNDISWVRGYENVLGPMEEVSALFYEKVLRPGLPLNDDRVRNALFHLMTVQTSCYRYWGQGIWTDYARELCRRTQEILIHDL